MRFLLFILFVFRLSVQAQIPAIGNWREHLPWQNALALAQGDELYCATTYAVFSVDNEGAITRYSKTNGLSDIGISTIAWDASSQQLIIAYTNSNIDIVKNGTVKNIGDILRSNIPAAKNINHIYCSNKLAYLSTSLGIIVVDLVKYEIKDTWLIGNNGSFVSCKSFTEANGFWFAATEQGLKRIAANHPNPANFANWSNLGRNNIEQLASINQQLFVQEADTVFTLSGNNFIPLYTSNGWTISHLNNSNNHLLVCQQTTQGNSRVIQLTSNGQLVRTLQVAGVISAPKQAIMVDNDIWVADYFGGLSKHNNSVSRFIPNGPPDKADGPLQFYGNNLTVAAGSVNSAWNYQYNRNGLYFFDGNVWSSKSSFNTLALDSVLDFITLAPSTLNNQIWAGSYGGGLVGFSNNQIQIFKQNSSLQPAIGDPGSYRISGLSVDKEQNIWIANYGTAEQLHVRKPNGSFKAFAIPFSLFDNAISTLIADKEGLVWMVSPRGNGLIVYQPNQIDNLADDRWKFFRAGNNNGNLPSNNVFCISSDKNNLLWIGTDKGLALLNCPQNSFSINCNAVQPIIQQGPFAGLALQNETIQHIAIDGANRKWIATNNGAWLLNPDCDKVEAYFNQTNSGLLSNRVTAIAVHPQSGEVFFCTANGICSYRGTATDASASNSHVLVFPNPVPPQYKGTIAISGLPENSLVKIAEPNGKLVHQTRSLGGQAIWNGFNYKGQRPASGVYLVFARTDEGCCFITMGLKMAISKPSKEPTASA
jgi:ligand-binding sensor domain-containing protein